MSIVHTESPVFIDSVQGSCSVQCSYTVSRVRPVFIRSDLHLYIVSNAHTKSPGFMECPVSRVHAQCPDFIRSDRCSCVMSESGNVWGLGWALASSGESWG